MLNEFIDRGNDGLGRELLLGERIGVRVNPWVLILVQSWLLGGAILAREL